MDDLTAALRAYFDVIHACTAKRRGVPGAMPWDDPTLMYAAASAVDSALGSPAPALRTLCNRYIVSGQPGDLIEADRAASALASPGAATVVALSIIGDVWRAVHRNGNGWILVACEFGCQSVVELAPELTDEVSKACYDSDTRQLRDVGGRGVLELAISVSLYYHPCKASAVRLLDDDAAPVAYKLIAAVVLTATSDDILSDNWIWQIATGMVELVKPTLQPQLPPVIV